MKQLIAVLAALAALWPGVALTQGLPSGPNSPFTGCVNANMVVVEVNMRGMCMPAFPSLACPPGYVGVNGAPVRTGHDSVPYPVCEPLWVP